MTRREAFQRISLLLGGVALSPDLLAKALSEPAKKTPQERVQVLDEMAETIIPATDTPGAKAAKVGEFIVQAVENCLPAKRKTSFWEGLENAEAACRRKNGKSFIDCSEQERTALFQQLQAEKPLPGSDVPTFFTALKMLVLHGYFTSEIGATQALNYDPIPGGWVADMPADERTKAWTPVF